MQSSEAVWFDSHCHLDFPVFDGDREAVWARARALFVEQVFVPGVTGRQWSKLASLKADLPGVHVGVGLHPYFLHEQSDAERETALSEMPEWCDRLGAVAIGECGLDGRLAKQGGLSLARQVAVLERHMAVATECRLPLVVHVVAAHGTALELFERFGRLPRGGVLHSYSGSAELVPRYVRLGLSFGFSAAVCDQRRRKVHDALRAVPSDRLLLETDAPDQPSQSARARGNLRNEPSSLLEVAKTVAALRGVTERELALFTTRNAEQLYAPNSGAR